jgi:hypothetical protein
MPFKNRRDKQKYMKAYDAKRYYNRKAQGLCVKCGEPAVRGYVRCFDCHIKDCQGAICFERMVAAAGAMPQYPEYIPKRDFKEAKVCVTE